MFLTGAHPPTGFLGSARGETPHQTDFHNVIILVDLCIRHETRLSVLRVSQRNAKQLDLQLNKRLCSPPPTVLVLISNIMKGFHGSLLTEIRLATLPGASISLNSAVFRGI